MTELLRLRASWEGSGIVGPAVSTFMTAGAEPAALRAAVGSFFNTLTQNLPAGVFITIPSSGEKIDEATGDFIDIWTVAAPPLVYAGADSGVYAKGVGCRVVWETVGVRNNRRVRGSTFLCPIAAGGFDTDGGLNNTFVGRMRDAAIGLVGALPSEMIIYSRPKGDLPGVAHVVTGSVVPDKVSWLISRRT